MGSERANLCLRMHSSRTMLLIVLAAFLTLRQALGALLRLKLFSQALSSDLAIEGSRPAFVQAAFERDREVV